MVSGNLYVQVGGPPLSRSRRRKHAADSFMLADAMHSYFKKAGEILPSGSQGS